MISVIKTEAHYREVLERLGSLAASDPPADSPDGKELGVLALLVQDYERRTYLLSPRSPLAALRLRMDQASLTPKDLIPYLGSRSRVSEVLSAKRPLSLAMIRALHTGLGIPLESLVSEESEENPSDQIEWDRFPIRELIRRGWIEGHSPIKKHIAYERAKDIMHEFLAPIGGPAAIGTVLHKADLVRTARASDRYALAAWSAFVLREAEKNKASNKFNRTDWSTERLRELRTLSRFEVGPRLAIESLAQDGVIIVIAPHLPRTRLDGGAMLRLDGTPVIGLTIRHDRLDNFWFTLFHELMHVLLHLKSDRSESVGYSRFLDDLDVAPDVSPLESEADDAAREALLPLTEWVQSAVRFVVAPATVVQLARAVGVSEAVVAGRVRYEKRNYRLLSSMIGVGKVRALFPEMTWPSEVS